MNQQVPCPFCGQEADEKAMSFEVSKNENVKLELSLFDVFKYIEDLKQELSQLSELTAQYVFKDKGDQS